MKSKNFKIGNLFKVSATQTNEITKFQNGKIPFICASNINNGIQGFVEPNKETVIEKGECISVSSLDGTSFWQPKDFIGRGHGSVNVLRHNKLNLHNSQYICATLKKQVEGKYNYSHQLFLNNLKNESISLPVDDNGEPNWKYMEESVKQLEESVKQLEESVKQKLLLAIPKLDDIDTSNWKKFKVGELFISKTGNISKLSNQEGTHPLISCSAINNGVIGTTDKADFQDCISVATNGCCGKCFYQKGKFGASIDTLMLLHKNLTENSALFISTVLEKQLINKYNYANKNKGSKTLNESISLPVDDNGEPNWKYMEEYMTPHTISKK